MIVTSKGGEWFVTKEGEEVAGPFPTMSDAWHWIDRHEGEPIGRSEKVTDWLTSQRDGKL